MTGRSVPFLTMGTWILAVPDRSEVWFISTPPAIICRIASSSSAAPAVDSDSTLTNVGECDDARQIARAATHIATVDNALML